MHALGILFFDRNKKNNRSQIGKHILWTHGAATHYVYNKSAVDVCMSHIPLPLIHSVYLSAFIFSPFPFSCSIATIINVLLFTPSTTTVAVLCTCPVYTSSVCICVYILLSIVCCVLANCRLLAALHAVTCNLWKNSITFRFRFPNKSTDPAFFLIMIAFTFAFPSVM